MLSVGVGFLTLKAFVNHCVKYQSKIWYSRTKRKEKSTGRWQECVSVSGRLVIFFFVVFFFIFLVGFLLRDSFCFHFFSAQGRAETRRNNRWGEFLYSCCQRRFYENGFWGKQEKKETKDEDRYTEKVSLREREADREKDGGGGGKSEGTRWKESKA